MNLLLYTSTYYCLQCYDTVGWAWTSQRASGL